MLRDQLDHIRHLNIDKHTRPIRGIEAINGAARKERGQIQRIDTRIEFRRPVQWERDVLITNSPLWARNFHDFGRFSHSSLSNLPVIETELKVRNAATTPSSLPSLHSLMKSARFDDWGLMSSPYSLNESQAVWALSLSVILLTLVCNHTGQFSREVESLACSSCLFLIVWTLKDQLKWWVSFVDSSSVRVDYQWV